MTNNTRSDYCPLWMKGWQYSAAFVIQLGPETDIEVDDSRAGLGTSHRTRPRNFTYVWKPDSKENSQTSHEAQLNIQMEDLTGPGGTVTSVSANAPLSVTNPTTTPNISLGIVPAGNGGTGLGSAGASGNFLRSDGSAWKSASLTAADVPPDMGDQH